MKNFNGMSIEINKKKKLQQLEQVANLSTYPSRHFISFCTNDDDELNDDDFSVHKSENFIRVTLLQSHPTQPITDLLIMEDEHLDTISKTESDEEYESSVEDLNLTPSESEDLSDIERLLTVKVVGDISKHYVLMPRLLLSFSSENEVKVHLLSHRSFKAFQLFSESPMMIYGGNIPTLDFLSPTLSSLEPLKIAPDYEDPRELEVYVHRSRRSTINAFEESVIH
ncbi:hypothetical protein Tco_1393555 [Tanacetum coccineum]